VLTANIDLDEGTPSIDLLEAASAHYALTLAQGGAGSSKGLRGPPPCGGTLRERSARVLPKSPGWQAPFEHSERQQALALPKTGPIASRRSTIDKEND
jgi:serine/threonine-protein kinase HipA